MRRLSITFLGLCVGMLLHSKNLSVTFPEEILKDYTITQLNTEDGFLQDGVLDLWADKLGHIWLFNQSGLIKLNGAKVERYFHRNNNIIKSNRIKGSIQLKDGSMLYDYLEPKSAFYISALGEINSWPSDSLRSSASIFDQLDAHNLHFLQGAILPSFVLSKASNDFLYIDPTNNTTYVINESTISYYVNQQLENKTSLKNARSKFLSQTQAQGVVLNIDRKLYFLSIKNRASIPKIHPIEEGQLGPPQKITNVAFLAALTTCQYYRYFNSEQKRCIIQLDETIWELSIDGNQIEAHIILDHLPFQPKDILLDSENGQIFLTDVKHGFFILNKKQKFKYISDFSRGNNGASAVSFDEIQPGVIGYSNKLYTLEGDLIKTFPNQLEPFFFKNLSQNLSILGAQDQLWEKIGPLPSNEISALPNNFYKKETLIDALLAPKSYLWIASLHSITVYDLKNRTIKVEFSTQDSIAETLYCLALHDNQQEVWVGTSNGIYSFDIQTYKFKKRSFLEGSTVRAIQFYEDFALVGTYGDGIYAVQGEKVLPLTRDPNSSLLFTHAFVEDQDEFIWISTNNGLLKAAKAEIRCFLQGNCAEIYYHRFTTKDGLRSNEFNGGFQPCGIKLSNGHLAFASMGGVLNFDPTKITTAPLPKQILIEEALLDGEAINIGSEIVLPPRFQKLALRVKADAYWGNRDNLIFQYRIRGYADAWSAVPDDGQITINRIDKGAFSLEFRIHQGLDAAKKGMDKYVYKQINLKFQARLVETFYFYMLLFSLGLLVAYLIYRVRLYYLRKQNQVLDALVKSKTAELLNVNLELKENNSIKNLMLGIFNHDIASNLRYLSLLTRGIQTSLSSTQIDHEIQEDFDLLTTTIHNLNAQTQGYLQWILLNRQGSKLSLANIQLLPIVQQVQDSLQQLANENNKKIVVDLEAPLWVYSHPLIIKSLLLNIIDNYIKYGNSDELTITGNVQTNSLQIAYGTSTSFDFLSLNRFVNEENNKGKEAIFISPERKNSGGLGFYIIRDLLKKNQAQLQLSKPDSNLLYEIKFPNSKPI